jgi:hypothetical protein
VNVKGIGGKDWMLLADQNCFKLQNVFFFGSSTQLTTSREVL